MPCFQSSAPYQGFGPTSGPHATEADCLNACKEGACCESNGTCNVRPQCQCQGAGQTFQGIGTVCSPSPCPCGTYCGGFPPPLSVTATVFNYSGMEFIGKSINGTYTLQRSGGSACAAWLYTENSFPGSCFDFSDPSVAFSVSTGFLEPELFVNHGFFVFLGIRGTTSEGCRHATGGVTQTGIACSLPINRTVSGVPLIRRTASGFGQVQIGAYDITISSNPLP